VEGNKRGEGLEAAHSPLSSTEVKKIGAINPPLNLLKTQFLID
jgi:hypothetical protein